MLKLININKSYVTGKFSQQALNNVNIEFRKNEFVAILGPSGSGKTTLLNIIGGLDKYDSGDLIINNKSTRKFHKTEWDAYRNNCIGFIFQNYNLINHISILDNVEMGMTLSGVSSSKRKKKALEVLEKVGLKEHAHKKPNQLSGGQMQRVAIARALANNPSIILADEPTGALDSATSIQIMELIKEIAKDKLVIMVTHNAELANSYANRIIEFKDGMLVSDTNPIEKESNKDEKYKIKKTAMNFLTALKLSFNNIKTKKGRTLLTSFASSIGIIGITIILALSNGFNIEIDKFEKDTLSSMPIVISKQAMKLDKVEKSDNKEEYITKKIVYPVSPVDKQLVHINNIDNNYIDYVKSIDKELLSGISYTRTVSLNIIARHDNNYKQLLLDSAYFTMIPEKTSKVGVFEDNYDLLEGKFPTSKDELLLTVDSKNNVNKEILNSIGIDINKKEITFDEIINTQLKLIFNDEYYNEMNSFFTINNNLEGLYNSNNALTLKIVGIARGKKDKKVLTSDDSLLSYTSELVDYVIEKNNDSKIVQLQRNVDYNVLTGEKIDYAKTTKEELISYLGGNDIPIAIQLYPKDFKAKTSVIEYLDKYNVDRDLNNQILYTDLGKIFSSLSSSIMDAITIVLIAFSGISLLVSSIMIGIITYISVLERTKEIGILRALGARAKDISRVFNAETVIIGLISGLIGIFIGWIMTFPVNLIIKKLTELSNVAKLNPIHAIILVLISIALTMIGGAIPSKIASRKDPVEALRTE